MGTFSLSELTKQIAERHQQNPVERLVSKWARTGLLKSLSSYEIASMAKIQPCQGAEILRKSNSKGCSECGGTGQYVGLIVREECRACGSNVS